IAWQHYRAGHQQEAAAVFRVVLGEATAAGDRLGQAWCHFGLGEIGRGRAEYLTAREEFRQALEQYGSLHEEGGAAFASSRLGAVEYFLGNLETAREHYRAALAVFQRFGLRREQASLMGALAMAGDPDGPTLVEQYLAIAREIGDHKEEASALHMMGDGL